MPDELFVSAFAHQRANSAFNLCSKGCRRMVSEWLKKIRDKIAVLNRLLKRVREDRLTEVMVRIPALLLVS